MRALFFDIQDARVRYGQAEVLCGAPASEVAERAEAALRAVPADADSPLEAWQARLRQSFAPETAAA